MQGEVGHVLAPEAATEEGGVHDDLVRRHAAGLAEFAAQEVLALVGPPGLDLAVAHMDSGGQRLHGGVRDVGRVVVGRDGLAGRQHFTRLAQAAGHDSLVVRQACDELRMDALAVHAGRRAGVEFDVQRIGSLLGNPVRIGHHDHGAGLGVGPLRGAHDGMHARARAHLCLVADAHDAPRHAGRHAHGADQHAGHLDIDAEHRAAVDLGRRIHTAQVAADQALLGSRLHARPRGQGQPGGIGHDLAIAHAAARRGVQHAAGTRHALGGTHTQAACAGAQQHIARLGAGQAHAFIEIVHGHGGTHELLERHLARIVAIGVAPRDEAHGHAGPVGIQFIGQHLGQACVDALADLALRNADHHLARRLDPDPVADGCCRRRTGCRRRGLRQRNQQAACSRRHQQRSGALEQVPAPQRDGRIGHAAPFIAWTLRHGWPPGCGGRWRSGTDWSWPRRSAHRWAADGP